jgi:hypothetical protein
VLASDACGIDDLCLALGTDNVSSTALTLGTGWTRRWTTTWSTGEAEVVCPVQDLASVPIDSCQPVRRFGWRPRQRHRPGLQFVVSTGRHHGFESIAEQRLLVALDFAGDLVGVLSQPFALRFDTAAGSRTHVPDFLAVTCGGVWVFDVRPADRVEDADRVCFAATAEAALAVGWRYLVVTGWRSHVAVTLDTLSSQRRALTDPLGLQGQLLRQARCGPSTFGDLVAATSLPAVARAHALHLLWHRRLGVDLGRPLTDRSSVWAAAGGQR